MLIEIDQLINLYGGILLVTFSVLMPHYNSTVSCLVRTHGLLAEVTSGESPILIDPDSFAIAGS